MPTWEHELDLWQKGYTLVAGVDEAGRGAWAGPLVAGAVVLPQCDGPALAELTHELSLLRDSKMLLPTVREKLLCAIRRTALAVGVGIVSPALIDVIGLGPANRLAMCRAVRDLRIRPNFLLLDAFRLPSMPIPQRPVIKGDATCMSIAAASIVAKVTRDQIMHDLDLSQPGYDLAQHKGYGTRHHVEALMRRGVSPLHRRSYAPIKAILAGQPWPPVGETENGQQAACE
jgi:ribonuclease HII